MFVEGKYYRIENFTGESYIGCYHESNGKGPGFHCIDLHGYEFITVDKIPFDVKVTHLESIEVNSDFREKLAWLNSISNDIVGFSISLTMRDNTTISTSLNEWLPGLLIGEVACHLNYLVEDERLNHRKVSKD